MAIRKRTSGLGSLSKYNDNVKSGYGNFKIDRGDRKRRGPFKMVESPYKARKLKAGYSSVAGKDYNDMNWRERSAKRRDAKRSGGHRDHRKTAPRPNIIQRVRKLFGGEIDI